jgi:hypothetical protein|uniref:Uncharacterized protein n=1 Tax=viral metagenome TaxID=1070528 RepID=A0A6C0LHD2_9ZZZZ|tara:strand:+ start:855 stop:1103 length:249 start_codon:yes stop_codon:yes gene_type:complete
MLIDKFTNLLKSKNGKYVISIILGLGLASLFRKACDDNNCLVYRGTLYDEIEDNSFKHDDKCYKYTISSVSCNKGKKIIDFA